MKRIVDTLDLSSKRKVFAVGDIHGCYHLLYNKLSVLGFDQERDFLVSVGDLTDRGPNSLGCMDIIGKPWFKHIIGNHEEFCEDTANGNGYWHGVNGGEWMQGLPEEQKRLIADTLMDSSYLLEITTPKGKKVGFVHADLKENDWQDNIKYPSTEVFCWSRSRIKNAVNEPGMNNTITGIDHVFLGHTIIPEPKTFGNMSWIDTGAFHTGKLTVVDVDEWIEKHG